MDPLQQTPARPAPITDGSPYFFGDHALITFSSGEEGYSPDTYFLVDKVSHTIIPFVDEQSLQAVFGEDFDQAKQSAVSVATPNVSDDGSITGGIFNSYHILGPEYAIQPDGSAKKADFSPYDISRRYDKPVDDQKEQTSLRGLEDLLNKIKEVGDQSGVSAAFIDKVMRDQKLIAFWLNALSYGDYQVSDVWADIQRRAQMEGGASQPTAPELPAEGGMPDFGLQQQTNF